MDQETEQRTKAKAYELWVAANIRGIQFAILKKAEAQIPLEAMKTERAPSSDNH